MVTDCPANFHHSKSTEIRPMILQVLFIRSSFCLFSNSFHATRTQWLSVSRHIFRSFLYIYFFSVQNIQSSMEREMEKPCAKRANEREKIIIINKQKQVEQWHNKTTGQAEATKPTTAKNQPTDRPTETQKNDEKHTQRERERAKYFSLLYNFYNLIWNILCSSFLISSPIHSTHKIGTTTAAAAATAAPSTRTKNTTVISALSILYTHWFYHSLTRTSIHTYTHTVTDQPPPSVNTYVVRRRRMTRRSTQKSPSHTISMCFTPV